MSAFTDEYLAETARVVGALDGVSLGETVESLAWVRAQRGRVFVLGNGGGAANASHMVNDLRKMVAIEAYAPTDNVAELTARANDDGWDSTLLEWLRISRVCPSDAVFVLSVGGGTQDVSRNILKAVRYAYDMGAKVLGIVGKNGGITKLCGSPILIDSDSTPHVEEMQAVVWHLIVSHPRLRGHT